MRASFFLLFLILKNSNCWFHQSIIIDYFKSKEISPITVVSCLGAAEMTRLWRALIQESFAISFKFDHIIFSKHYREGAVLDLTCTEQHIISYLNREQLFSERVEWLMLKDTAETSGLSDSRILPSSCVTFALANSSATFYYDVYRVAMSRPLKFSLIGVQDHGGPLTLLERKSRANFENVTLNSATPILDPKTFTGFELEKSDTGNDSLAIYHHSISENLAKELNFILNLTIVDSYGWFRNGTMDGLIGYVARGDVDYSSAGVVFRHDRLNYVDYTGSTFAFRAAILFKQPPLSAVSNIYILPFSTLVWIAILVVTLLVIALLMMDTLVLRRYESNPFKTPTSVADIATLVFGVVCQQGTHLKPVSISARIVLFALSYLAIFLYTSYSANIVALLSSTDPVIHSLSDLIDSPLGLVVFDQEYNRILYKDNNDKNVQAIYKKKVQPLGGKGFVTLAEGVALVRTGQFAFNADLNLAYKVVGETFEEYEKCALSEIRLFFLGDLSMPIPKRSGYRQLITQKVAWQRESGHLRRIRTNWMHEKPQCEHKVVPFVQVGISEFLPAIYVLLLGLSVSLVIFIVEITKPLFYLITERTKIPLIKK